MIIIYKIHILRCIANLFKNFFFFLVDLPLCWRCHPGQECWHRLWPEGSYPPLREKAFAWRCTWCPRHCSVSAGPPERTPAVGGEALDSDRTTDTVIISVQQMGLSLLLEGHVCFGCGNFTVWSHPLIGPSSSGLVEELHGPRMSASCSSDEYSDGRTGIWGAGGETLWF